MINTETSRKSYVGNGSTTVFDYGFKIFAETDLMVYVDNILKTLTTHYTVSGVGLESGTRNVTFLSAPASGAKIEIFRSVPLKQLTDYVANDSFPAQTHEETLDKIVQQIQMLKDMLRKAPMLGLGTVDKDISLGDPVAGKTLIWSLDGKSVISGVDASSRVAAKLNGTQAVTDNTDTKVVLDTEEIDNLNEFNPATYKFTALHDGEYIMTAYVDASPVGSGQIQAWFLKNGTVVAAKEKSGTAATGTNSYTTLSTIINLLATEYIELWVRGNTAGGWTINNARIRIARLF